MIVIRMEGKLSAEVVPALTAGQIENLEKLGVEKQPICWSLAAVLQNISSMSSV